MLDVVSVFLASVIEIIRKNINQQVVKRCRPICSNNINHIKDKSDKFPLSNNTVSKS